MDSLRLQGFFVWRPYTMREFYSKDFPALVAADWRQILRLNELLEKALQGGPAAPEPRQRPSRLSDHLETIEAPRRPMDF
jgi:hypothetical protein